MRKKKYARIESNRQTIAVMDCKCDERSVNRTVLSAHVTDTNAIKLSIYLELMLVLLLAAMLPMPIPMQAQS